MIVNRFSKERSLEIFRNLFSQNFEMKNVSIYNANGNGSLQGIENLEGEIVESIVFVIFFCGNGRCGGLC